MSILFAVILGIIQGLTEFLPVSSSGHLAMAQILFGVNGGQDMLLDVLLHLGTLVSIVIYYRKDVWDILSHLTKRRIVPLVIIATLPLFAAVFVSDYTKSLYNSSLFIGCAWIVTGIVLFLSDKVIAGRKDEESAKWYDALIVGIAQAIAILPGISRSGSTITASLFRGFRRDFAVKFSFLLSIPAILGANILELKNALELGIDTTLLPAYALGIIAAAGSGWLAIRAVNWIAAKARFKYFGIYCAILGIIAVTASLIMR
jgi:undecaprenyl-diphosphatase